MDIPPELVEARTSGRTRTAVASRRRRRRTRLTGGERGVLRRAGRAHPGRGCRPGARRCPTRFLGVPTCIIERQYPAFASRPRSIPTAPRWRPYRATPRGRTPTCLISSLATLKRRSRQVRQSSRRRNRSRCSGPLRTRATPMAAEFTDHLVITLIEEGYPGSDDKGHPVPVVFDEKF